jgi:hypothetical protein
VTPREYEALAAELVDGGSVCARGGELTTAGLLELLDMLEEVSKMKRDDPEVSDELCDGIALAVAAVRDDLRRAADGA